MKNSLERFRTVAFDRDLMRQLISVGQAIQEPNGQVTVIKELAPDVLCCVPWFLIVPEPYKPDVAKLVDEAFQQIKNRKFSEELVEEFIGRLHQLIWERLEYKPPEGRSYGDHET